MKHLLGILSLTFSGQTISAQTLSRSVLASGGSSFSSTALQADWTIGETVVGLFNGSNLFVCQGFQQGPDDAASAIEQSFVNEIRLWPNPTSGLISLQHNGQADISKTSLFWSSEGKRINIRWDQNSDGSWQSNIGNLSAGTYVLQLQNGEKRLSIMVVKY